METLLKVAKKLCPTHLDDIAHEEWINGFIWGSKFTNSNQINSKPIKLCGLLWDSENLDIGGFEKDGNHYYTYNEARYIAKFIGKRLPTYEEWEELSKLKSVWDNNRSGYHFIDLNSNLPIEECSIFLPANGLYQPDKDNIVGLQLYGHYWSSSVCFRNKSQVSCMYFRENLINPVDCCNHVCRFSVRLVKDIK